MEGTRQPVSKTEGVIAFSDAALVVDNSPTSPPESRAAKFAWSAALTWGYQGLALLIGLWLTRYLLAQLGEAVLGWWAQVLVFVGYLGMVDFGLSSLLPREVAANIGRSGGWQNAVDLPSIIARFAKFALWQSLLAAAGAVLIGILLTRSDDAPLGAVLGLLAVSILAVPLRVANGVLTGLQDVRFSGIAQLCVYLTSVAVTVSSVAAGLGVAGLVLGLAVQSLLSAALVWTRLVISFRTVLPHVKDLLAARVPIDMLIDGGWAWLATIGIMLAGTADVLVIAFFHPPEVVFQYVCTVKLMVIANPILVTLCQAAQPGLTELRASADVRRIQRATLAYTQLILGLSGLFGCVMFACNAGFVSWWVGPSRYLGDSVMWIAVIGMNLRHWLNALAVTMFCLNLERPLWQLTLLDGAVSLLASVGCVWWGGAEVGPLGPLIAAIAVTLPAVVRAVAHEGTISLIQLMLPLTLWGPAYAALAVAAAWVGWYVDPHSWQLLALTGAGIGAMYVTVMAYPLLRSELGHYLQPWFRKSSFGRVQ